MAHPKTLSAQQLALLAWVEQGCPDGIMEGTAHRVSAAALKSRGLVRITGRGPTWAATITEAGREYLARAERPESPPPRQGNHSVTQRLVDEVIAAGGSRRYPRKKYWEKGTDYAQRAAIAVKWRKVPPGQTLAVRDVSDHEIEIELVDAVQVELAPVPVPDHVAKYHPVVREFKERKQRHEVSRALLPRALRVLEGLTREAERRGYEVAVAADPAGDRYGRHEWSGKQHGHLVISGGEKVAIRVSEVGLQSRAHWERKNRTWSHGPGLTSHYKLPPLSDYEEKASGKLALELVSGWTGRRARFSDTQRSQIEPLLPELLAEIELRAEEARERESARQREAEEKQRAWEAALVEARRRYAEAQRAEALATQSERWQQAERIRAYCDAAEAAHGDAAGTREWIAWARRYADGLDPLREPPRAPLPPDDISPHELRPFLDGWDAHGPTRAYPYR